VGYGNTADGVGALADNSTGANNTATGISALAVNESGFQNVAYGESALSSLTTGSNNTAIGSGALSSNYNPAGSNNIAIGYLAGNSVQSGNNNIEIGTQGNSGDSNAINIGVEGTQTTTYIAGIYAENVGASADYVVVNANGQLGTAATTISSIDPRKLNDALVKLNERNAKLEATVADQAKTIAQMRQQAQATAAGQQQQIKDLTACLKEQASLLQKVSAQIQVSRPAPQVAANNN
jgi:hypothetical protein